DVALLSASPTLGWRMADDALAAQVRAAGLSCAVVRVAGHRGRRLHYAPLIDLYEAGAAWRRRLPDARAVVVSSVTAAFFVRPRVAEPPGLEWAGIVPRAEWLALLGRARLFVQASRFEDHGIAPLEALSAGAKLVSVETAGPYPALAMARSLAPSLVSEDLAA